MSNGMDNPFQSTAGPQYEFLTVSPRNQKTGQEKKKEEQPLVLFPLPFHHKNNSRSFFAAKPLNSDPNPAISKFGVSAYPEDARHQWY